MTGDHIDKLIGGNLRRLREERGMSQLDVGRLLGMEKTKISGYETGHIVMGKDVMSRFCKALAVDPWQFYVTPDAPLVINDYDKAMIDLGRKAKERGVEEELARYGEYLTEGKGESSHHPSRKGEGGAPRVARVRRRAG